MKWIGKVPGLFLTIGTSAFQSIIGLKQKVDMSRHESGVEYVRNQYQEDEDSNV